jgi:hypothetical protein
MMKILTLNMPRSPDGIVETDAILEADVHVVEFLPSRSCDSVSIRRKLLTSDTVRY